MQYAYMYITYAYKYANVNKPFVHLKDVNKTSAELGIEVQVEQVSLVLLFLQDLTILIFLQQSYYYIFGYGIKGDQDDCRFRWKYL